MDDNTNDLVKPASTDNADISVINANMDKIYAAYLLKANQTQITNINNTSDANKPVSTEQAAADTVNANNLAAHLTENVQQFTQLQSNLIDTEINLEVLKGSVLTGVNSNICVETFQNINDINITHGIYDSTNKNIYLDTNTKVLGFGFCFE